VNVSTTIWLAQNETFTEDLDKTAAKILEAVGGTPVVDTCTVTLSGSGSAGGGTNVPLSPVPGVAPPAPTSA